MENLIPQKAIEIAEARFYLGQRDGLRNDVMMAVKTACGERRLRHVKLFRDDAGLYVRLGKRAQTKRYLSDLAGARVVAHDLVVFYEY